jgi:hypothetical protein
MGRTRLRRAVVSVLCLCLLGLSGCEYKKVKVQLPTFFSSGIEELHFWRLDERRSEYVRSGHLRFSSVYGPPGRKAIEYTMINPDGSMGLKLTAPVKVKGDSILVQLNFARWAEPGWFRVSARNEVGESALSGTEIYL